MNQRIQPHEYPLSGLRTKMFVEQCYLPTVGIAIRLLNMNIIDI